MVTIDLKDVQGFLLRGYKRMAYSNYLLLQVTDAALAKKWINEIQGSITDASHVPETTCMNIGFTNQGLLALGLSEENLGNFSKEFREGMVTPHRQRLLGDYDESAPENWNWGGTKNDRVDIMLMIFGATEELLNKLHGDVLQQINSSGLKVVIELDGHRLQDDKEHFGFRDGISQPSVEGSGIAGIPDNTVATGEFLMGHKNVYNVFPQSPLLTQEQGNMNLLPADMDGSGLKDLGNNGSYLVFRQMQQHVDKFWNFMNDKTKNEDGSVNEKESIKLASKMVGRWPSGSPIVKYPEKDPGVLSNDDDFNYADADPEGTKCPFGSHLRRCNPRDTFEDNGQKESLKLSNRHRIIRRARHYGSYETGSPSNTDIEGEVGLYFMCFNADISRQFEFVQHTWANTPRVRELYNDPDPIIGTMSHPEEMGETKQVFTIQQKPVSKCIDGLQRFVRIRGGAYFFYPSLNAIRYIASL